MVDEKLIEYRKRAESKRTTKKVSFNLETEKEMLEFANNVDFSKWVKEKIHEELNHK